MIAKKQTLQQAIEFRKRYPCWTLQRIATEIGVTRERVRQILASNNLPTRGIKRYEYICWYCDIPLTPYNSRLSHGQANLVCRKCYQEYERFVTVSCVECSGLFARKYAEIIRAKPNSVTKKFQDHYFCSKECQGKWLAKNYGFGAFPEHQRFGNVKRKLTKEQMTKKYEDLISLYNELHEKSPKFYRDELATRTGLNLRKLDGRLSRLRKRGIIDAN